MENLNIVPPGTSTSAIHKTDINENILNAVLNERAHEQYQKSGNVTTNYIMVSLITMVFTMLMCNIFLDTNISHFIIWAPFYCPVLLNIALIILNFILSKLNRLIGR